MVHICLNVNGRRRVEFVTDLRWDQASRKVVFHDIFKFEALRKTEEGMIEGRWNVDRSVPSFLNKYQKRRVPISKDLFDTKEE